MLAAFMAKYPRVVMHLEATNRRVDVVAEAMDVAIRVRPPPLEDSDLVMRVFARPRPMSRGESDSCSSDSARRACRPI